jgi:hypothetical protein
MFQKSQDKKHSYEARVIDGKTRLLGRGFVIEFRFHFRVTMIARAVRSYQTLRSFMIAKNTGTNIRT